LAEKLRLPDHLRLACQTRLAGDATLRRLVLDEADLTIASLLGDEAQTRVGEQKNIVVLFSDIAGFTSISENLSPYDVLFLLNKYYSAMGTIVEATGGYIDNFIGDGLMALYGMENEPDFALASIKAGLDMLAAVDRIRPQFRATYGIDFNIRIGLHHGEAVIGSLGHGTRRRLTAIGDVVNLGLAYMLLARYPQAEERLRQAWSLEPANPLFGLNLADTLLLERRPAEAMAVYRRVVELAARDPAAAGWQLLSCRAQALAHLGRRAQAAAAAQRVLILAQGNAQANFEVALVYCLVGDDASALVNAEAALQQGYAPVWFGLPWFDRLRATPELAALITARQQQVAQPPAASTAGGSRQAR